MDTVSDINSSVLESLSDDYMRRKILSSSKIPFLSLLYNLLQEDHSPVVRSKLSDNKETFEGTIKLSQLVPQLLSSVSLLSGFLYMAIHRSARQAQESVGRSDSSFCHLIDKLRRCSGLGLIFYSRCSDSRVPKNHAKERLSQAYRLHLAFISAIVDVFETGPLESLDDVRWKRIGKHEKECLEYLQESENFLFNTIKDQNFQSGTNTTHNPEPDTRARSVYMLPKKPARFFGRENELSRIRQTLNENQSVTISGMAGVGKTSVALQFAHQSLSDYSTILWMRGEPTTALDQSCVEALIRFGIVEEGTKAGPVNRQKWMDFLSQSAHRWMIIFDNVDEAADLEHFWPMNENGKIVITTRSSMVGYQLTEDEIPIRPFTDEEGQKFIVNLTSWPGGARADPDSARELSHELGGLPIGIVQMTALMRVQKTPIKKFITGYKQNTLKYHSKQVSGIGGVYPDVKPNIGTNWTMSFSALEDRAKSLLGILSFLSPDDIPQELFKHWDESESRQTHELLQYCQTPDDFLEVEGELITLALLDKDANTEALTLHRLQQIQFEQFLDAPARQCAFEQATRLLYDIFPKEHIGQRFTGRWHECAMYIQHAIALNSHFVEQKPLLAKYLAPPEFAKLMAWCSWYLFEVADYTNFRRIIEGGLKACKEASSENFDEATWSMLNYNAGTVETSVGRFEEAKLYLNRALDVRRKLGNSDDIAAVLNNLGLLYNSIHQFELAKKHYSEALEIHFGRADSQDRNLSLTMVKHNLQRNAIQYGRELPSIDELQSTVSFFKTTPSWWMTGHACLVLGNMFYHKQEYEAAGKAFAEAQDLLNVSGRAENQPAVAMIIYKLGCVAFKQGSYNKAAQYFRQSIAISSAYPDIPAEQARTQFMLAQVLRVGAEPVEKEEEMRAEMKVNSLMTIYHTSNGNSYFEPCSCDSDFHTFITAKYQ